MFTLTFGWKDSLRVDNAAVASERSWIMAKSVGRESYYTKQWVFDWKKYKENVSASSCFISSENNQVLQERNWRLTSRTLMPAATLRNKTQRATHWATSSSVVRLDCFLSLWRRLTPKRPLCTFFDQILTVWCKILFLPIASKMRVSCKKTYHLLIVHSCRQRE